MTDLRHHMGIICEAVLGHNAFVSMPLPKAMEATALVFFKDNDQTVWASVLRKGLKELNKTGAI